MGQSVKPSKRPADTRKLKTQHNVSSFVVLSVLFLVFSLYLQGSYQQGRKSEYERLSILGSRAASHFEGLLDTMSITMRILDQWIQDHPSRDPRYDPEFLRLVDIYRGDSGGMIDLRMVSSSGGLFYLPTKDATALSDVSDREYYVGQLNAQAGNILFAAPVKSRVTGLWGIPISFRLRPNKHGLLIIFAALEYRSIDSLFAQDELDPRISTTLSRSDNLMLYRRPFSEDLVGFKIEQKFKSGTVNILRLPERGGAARLFAYRELSDYGLAVSVGEDYHALRATWVRDHLLRIALGLALGIILILFFFRTSKLIKQLKKSMDETKTLSGLLPICANCKKIRDDGGYWNKIESYFRSHSAVEITHGLCPDCLQELYPEMAEELQEKS